MTKTTKYKIAVATWGLRNYTGDSYYDRLTTAPRIVAVAESQADADRWIDQQMAAQEDRIPLRPGQGEHTLYTTYRLDDPRAFASRQDAMRFDIDVWARRRGIVNDPNIVHI